MTLMETKDREGSAAAGQEQRSEGRDRAQDPLPTGTPAELSPADSTTSARLWGGHPLPRPCCWHSGDTAQGCQGAWRLSKRAWQVEEASVKKKRVLMNIFTLWLSCKACALSLPCRLVAVTGISPGMGSSPPVPLRVLCPGCGSTACTAQTLHCELVKEN